MEKRYYSNGKLLLTGEYVVLNGATALAVPTKLGQELIVRESTPGKIRWIAYDADGSVWIDLELHYADIFGYRKGEVSVKATLTQILHEAWKLNPMCFAPGSGYHVQTELGFPRQWGLGTSSTLLANVAQWTGTNPYVLLEKSFGGSGYDIACAMNDTAILYTLENGLPLVEPIVFEPAFADKLYFVYLNKKQSSRNAIAAYQNNQSEVRPVIATISAISEAIYKTDDVHVFSRLLSKHEAYISDLLETDTVGYGIFADFPGTVKSLGAWGGDFILAVSDKDPAAYFNAKGYHIVIPWPEMIL